MAEVSSEYWAYNDPRWANDPAYGNPETMKYVGPWEQVLQATGFRGKVYEPMIEMQPDPNGGFMPLEVGQQYTPQAKAAIDSLRAAGYDLRWKHPDKRTFNTYYGLVTPSGEVQDIKIAGSDLGDAIMPMIKVFGAGLGLAGLGAGINSLLGGAGAGTGIGAGTAVGAANALTPAAIEAGLGTAGYGFNAGAAASGAFAPTAIGAGAALPFESILSSNGGALTAADLANLPADVLGQSGQIQNVVTPAAAASDAAAIEAMQFENALLPSSQTNVAYPYGGELPYVNPTQATVGTVPGGSVGTPIISDYSVAANTLESMGIPATPENINALLGIDTAGVATTASSGGISALDQALLDMGAGATNVGAGAANAGAGLSAEPLDSALAGGAPVGATTGTASLGGVGLPELTAAPAAAAGGGGDFLSGMSDVAATEGAGVSGTGILTKGTNIPSAVFGGGSILDKAIDLIKSPAGGAILSGVGSVVGGITQANAAEAAANQQAEAARNALALQREMFEYQKGLLEPYRTAGTAALERLSGAMGLGGQAQQQMLEMDPGYGFRLGEGLKALERMQAARGSMLSGGAMKAGTEYAQKFASGEYQNAYNRLANIAGLGQTAGSQLGGAAQQFGQTAGQTGMDAANALAAGRYGRTSAYTTGMQGAANAYQNYLSQQQQNQLFRDIFGRTAIGS